MTEFKRKYPRFLTSAEVQLGAHEQGLQTAWMTDISKGGLFVKTDEPPPLQSRLSISLSGPDGRFELPVEVVHVVDESLSARTGRERGVGLQFVDLTPESKKALDHYVDSVANRMETKAMAAIERAGQAMTLMSKVKTLLDGISAESLYGAISLGPTATEAELSERLKELGTIFDEIPETLTGMQKGRVDAARDALRKLALLLNDPERRLDYDFRHGHFFADQRVAVAASREALAQMRKLWFERRPAIEAAAHDRASAAMRAADAEKLDQAIDEARAALELDPFHLELRESLSAWEKALLGKSSVSLPAFAAAKPS